MIFRFSYLPLAVFIYIVTVVSAVFLAVNLQVSSLLLFISSFFFSSYTILQSFKPFKDIRVAKFILPAISLVATALLAVPDVGFSSGARIPLTSIVLSIFLTVIQVYLLIFAPKVSRPSVNPNVYKLSSINDCNFLLNSGKEVALSSLVDRKTILVFFRGNWCPFDMIQLKDIERQFDALRNDGFTILGISSQSIEKQKEIKAYLKLSFELLKDKDLQFATDLGIVHQNGVPLGAFGFDKNTILPGFIWIDQELRVKKVLFQDNFRDRTNIRDFINQEQVSNDLPQNKSKSKSKNKNLGKWKEYFDFIINSVLTEIQLAEYKKSLMIDGEILKEFSILAISVEQLNDPASNERNQVNEICVGFNLKLAGEYRGQLVYTTGINEENHCYEVDAILAALEVANKFDKSVVILNALDEEKPEEEYIELFANLGETVASIDESSAASAYILDNKIVVAKFLFEVNQEDLIINSSPVVKIDKIKEKFTDNGVTNQRFQTIYNKLKKGAKLVAKKQ